MTMLAKGRQALAIIMLVVFATAILAGIFLPVYTDEIGWRFQERAALDGVDRMYTDICGPNTLAAPPFFMMPVRHYSAFFNTSFADPFYIRVSGILYALLWSALILLLIRNIVSDRGQRASLATAGFGLMGLGVLPLLLVWSRPEQPILLALTTALILACPKQAPAGGAVSPWGRSAAILVLAMIAMSYHFKAIILIPLFLLCLVLASRGRQAHLPRIIAGLLIAAAALISTRYWQNRVACPGDAILAAEYARHNLTSRFVGGGSLFTLVPAVFGNISLTGYVALAAPASNPMSQWLPAGQLTRDATWIWFRAMSFAWLLEVQVAIVCIGQAMFKRLRQRSFDPKILLSISLVGTALAWGATQLVRNDYEASFVLPLVMMGVLFAFASSTSRRLHKAVALLTAGLAMMAIVSVLLVTRTFAPSLARAWHQQGYIEAQPFSVANFGYSQLKPQIMATARQCGITSTPQPHGVMIDDLTYFAFIDSYRPIHRLGIFAMWKGRLDDPIAFLRSRKSGGIIAGCHLLSKDVRRRARRHGDFCCLGPPDW